MGNGKAKIRFRDKLGNKCLNVEYKQEQIIEAMIRLCAILAMKLNVNLGEMIFVKSAQLNVNLQLRPRKFDVKFAIVDLIKQFKVVRELSREDLIIFLTAQFDVKLLGYNSISLTQKVRVVRN